MVDSPRQELYEQNPTGRFSDRADDYVKYRPSYPAAAVDAILDGLNPPIAAADVGAGTGISARLLADRGVQVTAIEPNARMLEAGSGHVRVEWRSATAEETGLAAESVDLVLCAQSFHWFRPQQALQEFARILKPAGRLCLMWNQRHAGDPLTAGYRQAILDVGGEDPAERRQFDPSIVTATGRFGNVTALEFSNSQRLDLAGLLGRARSASYVPQDGPAREELTRRLTSLFDQHQDPTGHVTMQYVTEVYLYDRQMSASIRR